MKNLSQLRKQFEEHKKRLKPQPVLDYIIIIGLFGWIILLIFILLQHYGVMK